MYIVCFFHADKVEVEEYQYSNLKDAISHYEHFAHDDSCLYRFISVISYVNHMELLLRFRSFPVQSSFDFLEKKTDMLEQYRLQLVGKHVVLNAMQGEPKMRAQMQGTISFVDDQYQIHMHWNNGSTLPLVIGIDDFEAYSL